MPVVLNALRCLRRSAAHACCISLTVSPLLPTPSACLAGRSKGWGIVEFETPEEALTAINTLNGVEMGGRTILVREDREDRDVKQVGAGAAGGCVFATQQFN